MEVLKDIPDASVDSFVCDSPYNVGYKYATYQDRLEWVDYYNWQLDIIKQAERVLKPSGSVWWLSYPEQSAVMWNKIIEGTKLEPFEIITWIYHVNTSGKPFRKATRNWLWFVKDSTQTYIDDEQRLGQFRNLNDKRLFERMDKGERPVDYDWWLYEIVRNVHREKTAHPCQIPADMVHRIVKMTCPKGGIVIDPFSGSGTTAVVAKELGCHFITTDIDESYCEIARNRLNGVQDLFI
jgi:DNA modification methylase